MFELAKNWWIKFAIMAYPVSILLATIRRW